MDSPFNDLIVSFFPKNLFFPLSLYALTYYFLFSRNRFIEDSKIKTLIFRLSSLPLLFMIIFSSMYPILTNNYVIEADPYLTPFIASVTLPLSLFALLFIFIKKIMDTYFVSCFGIDEFKKYKCGNKYQYESNLIAIAILTVIFFVSIGFINNVEMTETLFLEELVYLPILFPFILFYRSRLGKRNFLVDKGTSMLYFTSNVISYVMIFIVINFA